MIETIESDFLKAYKAKNEVVLSVLRMVKSAMNNRKIELKVDSLPDADIIAIIRKEIKQRRDASVQFRNGDRADLAEIEEKEISVLETYLPAELSDEEILKAISNVIDELKPNGMQDFGKVMSTTMKKLEGQAEGNKVSSLVKQKLLNE